MLFKIDLPIEPDEIEIDIAGRNKAEGHIWFKKPDLSIDFIIEDNIITLKQIWITGNQQYEPNEVPFMQEWIVYILNRQRNKIMEVHEYSLLS